MYYVTKLVKGRYKYWWNEQSNTWYGVIFNAEEFTLLNATIIKRYFKAQIPDEQVKIEQS
jgi:hypothetical protein